MLHKKISFVFFGTPNLAVFVLEELEKGGAVPSLIVTAPDKPAGRGMRLTAPPVKVWAEKRSIPVLQPEKLDNDFVHVLNTQYSILNTLFIVAAYGKIIPQAILDIPEHGVLNVHPSLLPKHRGATPIQSAILSGDEETGVTIMQMDAGMDTGPILAESEKVNVESKTAQELGEILARKGGEMLVDIMPKWIAGEITSTPQNEAEATYTKKISKADGELDLNDDAETNWRKFRAFYPSPGTYFFTESGTRVKITDASFEDGRFVIKKVVPEGKKEMPYEQFTASRQ